VRAGSIMFEVQRAQNTRVGDETLVTLSPGLSPPECYNDGTYQGI